MLGGYELTQILHACVALGIPDLLADGPRRADEMAAELHADETNLRRLLRALVGLGILTQERDERFGLTGMGRRLSGEAADSLRPLALAYGTDWWWASWGRLLDSIRTGTPAFELANGRPAYGFMAEDPEAARVFSDYIYATTIEEAEAIVDAFDFSTTRVLVDVGGGEGALAQAVLGASPTTHAVVVDTPAVATWAAARLAQSGFGDRADAVASDIFRSVPTGGDLYVLRNVLHDWDDGSALEILRACRSAMSPEARLLVIGYPLDGATSRGVTIDLRLLVLTGGRERSVAEYRHLLEMTGFAVDEIVRTSAGPEMFIAHPAGLLDP